MEILLFLQRVSRTSQAQPEACEAFSCFGKRIGPEALNDVEGERGLGRSDCQGDHAAYPTPSFLIVFRNPMAAWLDRSERD